MTTSPLTTRPGVPRTLVCFSHLRWDFVRQRPQHLMTRAARTMQVFVWEEPIPTGGPRAFVELHPFPEDGVVALRPRVPEHVPAADVDAVLSELFAGWRASLAPAPWVAWFYAPLMLPVLGDAEPDAVVYDCMDELSAFAFADPRLREREERLMERADVVFTGGRSLYEARRHLHPNVHELPSAVDVEHFAQARAAGAISPADQADLPTPRVGYFGVVDERIDLDLVAAVAADDPGRSVVMVGPVVKIDPATLPQAPNLHWLGQRDYDQLPAYLAGWDVALMPFALNEATRNISPTKTLEYLAGGTPVASTPVPDVVATYSGLEAIAIEEPGEAFLSGVRSQLGLPPAGAWRDAADELVSSRTWDATFATMRRELDAVLEARPAPVRRASRPAERFDLLVVGAGYAGSVMAERLASAGQRVLVVDRRDHVGGNAHDRLDAAGILVHPYGPHIFHTKDAAVVDYLSQFTEWRPYEHRVLAAVAGKQLPLPINRTTLNELYGLHLETEAEAAAFLAARAEQREVRTSEDVVMNAVGRDLYETFFRGYTRKQWGLDPSELDAQVTSRIPTRTSTDDRYFEDRFQAMPAQGYTAMFERMLDHPLITVRTGVDHRDVRDTVDVAHTVFTGPVDEFFDHRYGRLPYRSLRFQHETVDVERYQPVAVVNYPAADVPFTRITEYKHLTGQVHPRTSISKEFPSAEGDPYYPIPRPQNAKLYSRYAALAAAHPDVTFVGRLATYRYLNMDQVVAQALDAAAALSRRLGRHSA